MSTKPAARFLVTNDRAFGSPDKPWVVSERCQSPNGGIAWTRFISCHAGCEEACAEARRLDAAHAAAVKTRGQP